MAIKLKRAYEARETTDGLRVLVDRLWPRGLSKQRAKIDLWAKEIAPSGLRRQIKGQTVTLVYAAKDTEHNNARVLKKHLTSK